MTTFLLATSSVHVTAAAADYLYATCGRRVERPVVEVLAQGMTEIASYLQELAAPLNATVFTNIGEDQSAEDTQDLYDWAGRETFGWAGIETVPGFEGYPWIHNGGRGQYLLRVLEAEVDARGIDVWFSSQAKRLLTEAGEVAGVVIERDGQDVQVMAAGGVVLACGGFEFDTQMLQDYLELPTMYGIGTPGNTGDGIRMAQQAGAALWHMWHVHGSYGFKFDNFPLAFRNHLGGVRRLNRPIAWILVDQKGRRFTNEAPPAPQDTMARPLAHLDAESGEYDRVPAWMIFDDEARRLGPIAKPLAINREHRYEWSPDNMKEIERGWIIRAATVAELADKTDLPCRALKTTIERWNTFVASGEDKDYARPRGTFVPVAQAPFHAVKVWPVVTNTQGGPRHDRHQRVIDAFGQPIPGLYAAGELGSLFSHIYMLGGNLSECIVGGRIAGRRAALGLDRV
jgi:succinate dehydrogenase/fumarate reductase flavoprotein subunit